MTILDAKLSTLPNGIRVVTAQIPRVESVALGIWIGVGSRHENKASSGISHFVEHLLFKGTKKRSARDISAEIEGHGGYLNAFTQEESTCYYARVAFDQLDQAVDVLSDMYANALFEGEEVEKERGVIIEEIMMYKDQPRHVVHDMLDVSLWPGHPLGRPIIGSPASLTDMNRRTLRDYKRSMYVPGNTVFAFAGRIEHEACVRHVRRVMGRMRQRRVPGHRKVTTAVKQRRTWLVCKDIEQAHLAMGFRIFGRNDPRRHALRVMNAVFGENMSSRLFQVVRETHGLAYSVHSSLSLYQDSGALVVSAGLDRARSLRALGLIVREARRLCERRVGRLELQRAKDYVVGQLRLGLESTSNQMMWIGDNVLCFGKVIAPEKSIDKLCAVTADDVQGLARQVFRYGRASLAMVSPDIVPADDGRADTALHRL